MLAARPAIPHYTVAAAVVLQNNRLLITQRPPNGLLGSLWEFPGGKLLPGEDLGECLTREILEELGVAIQVGGAFGVYRHAYSHFKVTLHAFCCSIVDDQLPQALQVQDLRWVSPAELVSYPMGKIDRQIAARLVESTLKEQEPC